MDGRFEMSFQYMPLYVGDWLRDTMHLSCSEQGIYFKMVMHCWSQQGPAPLDERHLCGITGARSGDEIEAMRRVLAEFFIKTEHGYFQKRVEKELLRSAEKSGKARKSAQHRWHPEPKPEQPRQPDANALRTHTDRSAKAMLPNPNPIPNTNTNTNTERTAAASRLPADFVPDLQVAIDLGILDPSMEADSFRDYWTAKAGKDACKLDWKATWRNWCRNSKRATPKAATRTIAGLI